MDAEQKSIKQLDSNKKLIQKALNLIEQMKALKAKLHLRDGAGQRYLQRIKPAQALLQQAEKEIISQFSGVSAQSSNQSDKKRNLLKSMNRKRQI